MNSNIYSVSKRFAGLTKKQSSVAQFGSYATNYDNQEITIAGKNASLTQKEFALANYFFQNQNKLLSRIHLLEKI